MRVAVKPAHLAELALRQLGPVFNVEDVAETEEELEGGVVGASSGRFVRCVVAYVYQPVEKVAGSSVPGGGRRSPELHTKEAHVA